MLSPNDIATMKFDRVMGRGYKPDDVEHYLRQVADEYAALLEQTKKQDEKLMVLADKLEEYRHDEESLRSALIGAQKLGDSVIRDAKAKASLLLDDANTKATSLVDGARKAIEREQTSYMRMKREVAAFRSKLQLLYKQHLEMINSIPGDDPLTEAAQAPVHQEEPEPPIYEEEPSYNRQPVAEQFEEEPLPQEDALPDLPEDVVLEYDQEPESADDQDIPPSRDGAPLLFGEGYRSKRKK